MNYKIINIKGYYNKFHIILSVLHLVHQTKSTKQSIGLKVVQQLTLLSCAAFFVPYLKVVSNGPLVIQLKLQKKTCIYQWQEPSFPQKSHRPKIKM